MLTLIISGRENDDSRLISHQALRKPRLSSASLCYHLRIENLYRQIKSRVERAQLVDLGELLFLVSHSVFSFPDNVLIFKSEKYPISLRLYCLIKFILTEDLKSQKRIADTNNGFPAYNPKKQNNIIVPRAKDLQLHFKNQISTPENPDLVYSNLIPSMISIFPT